MTSIKSEFSFKHPTVIRVGKTQRETTAMLGGNMRMKTVSEPMPCQESEEDVFPIEDGDREV